MQSKNVAEDFLKRMRKTDPDNPRWADKLAQLYSLADGTDTAVKTLEQDESAESEDQEEISRFYRLKQPAKAAFKAEYLEKTAFLAKDSLAVAKLHPKDWTCGDAVHHGNHVLGLCGLKEGDANRAVEYLIEASETAGSAQLDSFSPNMLLAQAILEGGGSDDAVLEYFEL